MRPYNFFNFIVAALLGCIVATSIFASSVLAAQITVKPTSIMQGGEGVNLYERVGGLSPLQTIQLVLLALVFGLLGLLFVEGNMLGRLYRWFANVTGVKVPLPSIRSRHV